MSNCNICGNTGLVQVERECEGATCTKLARCKCQSPTVRIPATQLTALMKAVIEIRIIAHAYGSRGWQQERAEETLSALKAAGIDGIEMEG